MQLHTFTRHQPVFSPQGPLSIWPTWSTLTARIDSAAAITALCTMAAELFPSMAEAMTSSATLGWVKGSLGLLLVVRQLRQQRGEEQ